jgi:hypothetical protein
LKNDRVGLKELKKYQFECNKIKEGGDLRMDKDNIDFMIVSPP